MQLAHISQHSDEPLDETIEKVERSTNLTRRQFIAGVSASAALLTLDGCARRAPTMPGLRREDREPVLIVGAGIAGLTAAYRLRQRGVPVRIVEAQDRVGGRMFSLRNAFPDGQVCELGGELIDTGHEHVRALAAELGLELDDLHALENPSIASDVWYFGGAFRSFEEITRALVPVAERLEADRKTWGEEFDPTYYASFGTEALDRMTIAEWLDRTGVNGWIRELLDVAYVTEYGMPIDQQSALNFLTMIDVGANEFRAYGDSDERFRVHRGNDLIPLSLARRLDDAIETGTVLEALSQRSDGTFSASLRRGASSRTVVASHVVLAIPFTTLRDVRLDVPLPEVKRRAIRELGYGTNAKLMIGFSDRVWRTRHRSNGSVLTSLPFQLTWETSRGQKGKAGILTNFSGGAQALGVGRGTAEAQAQQLVADLERIFPGAQAAHAGMKAVRFHWPSFPWTRGSYAGYLAGQWTSIRGAEREAVGQLYFAGEHCSLAAQGFMEGGCETGEQAAQDILAALGQPVRKPTTTP